MRKKDLQVELEAEHQKVSELEYKLRSAKKSAEGWQVRAKDAEAKDKTKVAIIADVRAALKTLAEHAGIAENYLIPEEKVTYTDDTTKPIYEERRVYKPCYCRLHSRYYPYRCSSCLNPEYETYVAGYKKVKKVEVVREKFDYDLLQNDLALVEQGVNLEEANKRLTKPKPPVKRAPARKPGAKR